MNDYRKIRRADLGRLRPHHTAMLHADSRLALTHFLASGNPARSVVITHHAPSLKSLPGRKHGQPISAAYASNLDGLILDQGPALWVHGHIHTPMDYIIGQTRMLNNACGYRDASDSSPATFRPDLVLEL